ncbi:MAG TPA: hypothetical protein VMW69_08200, partial [Spirochaetia bacterium]|nr:hypothetical protein [Spirochaetia bacterium]
SQHKLDSDNYPVFLKLLTLQNHWVADALLDGAIAEHFFDTVQPNRFILVSCFNMLGAFRPGEMYPRSLLVVIGLLKRVYEQPRDGYRVYPLNVTDVNNLAKHLDESEPQSYPLNQTILHLLDRVASLADPGVTPPSEKQMADVATQANNIRGKFLDQTKHVREAIPTELLRRGDYRAKEIAPTRVGNPSKSAAVKPPARKAAPTAKPKGGSSAKVAAATRAKAAPKRSASAKK